MPDDLLNFDERRRQRDDNPDVVRCARCGKMILATAIRCPECGVHFQGEAQDYTHPSERAGIRRPAVIWIAVVAVLLLVLLLTVIGRW